MIRLCTIIIGTGRSGTSLITQALEELGAAPPRVVVPPSKNNPRGTGEDVAVRDQMNLLSKRLGGRNGVNGLRPSNWRQHSGSQAAAEWAANYLLAAAEAAGGRNFFVKFPLISVFIPLWKEAASRVGVELRFVWATRDAVATIYSSMQAYGQHFNTALLRYTQRCYYMLLDAPNETLLFPYEFWQADPIGQLRELAELSGDMQPTHSSTTTGIYQKGLDHTPRHVDLYLNDAIVDLNRLIQGKRKRLDQVICRSEQDHENLMTSLENIMSGLAPTR